MPSVWLCCKYFCTGIDAHPCYSPLNWTNRLSRRARLKAAVWLSPNTLKSNLIPVSFRRQRKSWSCQIIYFKTINIAALVANTEISLISSLTIFFLMLCSGCWGVIALHTELFLGAACKQRQLCPIFPFSIAGMMKLQGWQMRGRRTGCISHREAVDWGGLEKTDPLVCVPAMVLTWL